MCSCGSLLGVTSATGEHSSRLRSRSDVVVAAHSAGGRVREPRSAGVRVRALGRRGLRVRPRRLVVRAASVPSGPRTRPTSGSRGRRRGGRARRAQRRSGRARRAARARGSLARGGLGAHRRAESASAISSGATASSSRRVTSSSAPGALTERQRGYECPGASERSRSGARGVLTGAHPAPATAAAHDPLHSAGSSRGGRWPLPVWLVARRCSFARNCSQVTWAG